MDHFVYPESVSKDLKVHKYIVMQTTVSVDSSEQNVEKFNPYEHCVKCHRIQGDNGEVIRKACTSE